MFAMASCFRLSKAFLNSIVTSPSFFFDVIASHTFSLHNTLGVCMRNLPKSGLLFVECSIKILFNSVHDDGA